MKTLNAFAYIAYEPEDAPDSTGEVLCFADTIVELAQRIGVSRNTIHRILKAQTDGRALCPRIQYDIRKVMLN